MLINGPTASTFKLLVFKKMGIMMEKHGSIDLFAKEVDGPLNELDLPDLLSPNQQLVLNSKLKMLNLLSTDSAHLLAQQRFSQNEWNLLLILFRSYPHYAPREVLLASLTSLSSTDCRQRLQEAEQSGSEAVKQELKPIRRAISAIRTKLEVVCPQIKISHIRSLGYALTTSSKEDWL